MVGQLHYKSSEPKPRYYVVRMDGQGKAPTKGHGRRLVAHQQAEKLAKANPGVEFIVVKLKASFTYTAELPISVS